MYCHVKNVCVEKVKTEIELLLSSAVFELFLTFSFVS
jgi:hypothetical protein